MAWHVKGKAREFCSCKMWCPCWIGPAQPDQGWCSGSVIFSIDEGDSDGIRLGGFTVAFLVDFPGDFFSGNGTARLYLDDKADNDQRRELEAIFSGRKGGPLEPAFGATITKWLPAEFAVIEVADGEEPTIRVGEVAQATYSKPLADPAGHLTEIRDAAAATAFGFGSLNLARSDGSRSSDPDLRKWESGGSGTLTTFDWST
jgi:hypothetical protein